MATLFLDQGFKSFMFNVQGWRPVSMAKAVSRVQVSMAKAVS